MKDGVGDGLAAAARARPLALRSRREAALLSSWSRRRVAMQSDLMQMEIEGPFIASSRLSWMMLALGSHVGWRQISVAVPVAEAVAVAEADKVGCAERDGSGDAERGAEAVAESDGAGVAEFGAEAVAEALLVAVALSLAVGEPVGVVA